MNKYILILRLALSERISQESIITCRGEQLLVDLTGPLLFVAASRSPAQVKYYENEFTKVDTLS